MEVWCNERDSLGFAVAHLGYDDIPPIKCVLGQLVFCRSKIGDKFAPNAAPGLFVCGLEIRAWLRLQRRGSGFGPLKA